VGIAAFAGALPVFRARLEDASSFAFFSAAISCIRPAGLMLVSYFSVE
jgi:hypothetical protein